MIVPFPIMDNHVDIFVRHLQWNHQIIYEHMHVLYLL